MGCPRFSVVIPVYNRADVVRRALDSVLAQDLSDLEVIVVDDGSTDETSARLQQVEDPRVRTVRQDRSGPGAARNYGAALATGRFLAFLDSDDEVTPQWLSRIDELVQSQEVALVSCSVREVGTHAFGHVARVIHPRPHPLFPVRALLLAGAYVVRRSLFEAVGGFCVQQRAGEHAELALRLLPLLLENGYRTAATPESLVVRHVSGADRMRRDDRVVFEGGRRLLDVHLERYARKPAYLAAQASSTAVRAVRLGEMGEARRYLWLAARARPLNLKAWVRFVAVLVPPVARRLWPGEGAPTRRLLRLRGQAR